MNTKRKSETKEAPLYWIALNIIQAIDPGLVNKLIEHYKSPRAVWEAPIEEIEALAFVTPAARKHLAQARKTGLNDAKKELAEAHKAGAEILTRESSGYPEMLLQIHTPPPALYIKGKKAAPETVAVAIVGTRKCTAYGRDVASELAGGLARNGVSVVSGLAHGIDTAAHQGALRAGGHTIAVLGTGLNVIYPPINKNLSEEIATTGALMSEFPMNAGPEKWNFPRRNRIISGLCKGVVVVEAAPGSGALITTTYAMEQGREVFAVPGNVKNALNKGPHQLIRDGAALVESAEDILRELNLQPGQAELDFGVNLEGTEKIFYDMISSEPKNFDEICRESGNTAAMAAPILTNLEMKGFIRQLPGRLFVRRT